MKKIFLFCIAVMFVLGTNIYAQRILLSQGFENGPYTADSLPLKWAKVKVNGPGQCTSPAADWRVRDSGKVFCNTNTNPGFTSKAYNSRKGLSIPWTSAPANTDDWVFTDSLRIATGDSLIFWCQLGTWPDGVSTYYLDSLQVWVTTGQTPATQLTRLGTVKSLPQATNRWQNIVYDLSAYNGQKIYVAFRYFMNTSIDGIMVNIDSVMVRNLSGPPVAVQNNNGLVPDRFDLKQNYPNPFNPTTAIGYDVANKEFINITVYNAVGQEVAVLVNEVKDAGSYEINFDASKLPSGVYIYRIKAGSFTKSVKMSLIK